MPNIGAFIAWGIITALFIPTGWLPNETLAKLVGPMITYLLPLLIGYTGGRLVGGDRGGVVGAITTMGVIVGADMPMFLGAMIAGPLGGWAIKHFDRWVDGKIKSGFEMLVNNFSAGIIGMLLAILAFLGIGPLVEVLSKLLAAGVHVMVTNNLLPLASIFVEPAKILFLNNAINHGIFSPLGIQQATEAGKSVFFLIEANPGPGMGVLMAYMFFGRGSAKQSAGGAAIIARIIVRDNWSGDELARRLSVLSIAFITALGGGQFIGGLLSQYSHWQMGFVLMGATGLAILALMVTLPLEAGRAREPRPAMAATYFAILRRPGFFWPACVGGLGFATTVTLQEVSPFVMQQGFGLNVTAFGALGLVIGVAYFSGALTVNRTVARVGGKKLMQTGSGIVALATAAILLLWWSGILAGLSGMALFIALYCLTIFGQAVLFPNSMAMAVSDAKEYGAYAMALCGFLQQCLAGVAAAGAVLLEHHGLWALAIALLGLGGWLMVKLRM
ncbi:MFS transporter [Serratia marcescens]|uniref:MFS transporter n=1 Tax=Serratia marcescens TaxID=615 RepID=UPI0023E7E9F8|nr:MFS transporter [Serratia marcescens]